MSDLPEGWINTNGGNLFTQILGGGTPSKSNASFFQGNIPFMTVKDMKERFPSDTIDHISTEAIEYSSTIVVPADTLIVATRMSLGKIVRPLVATAINQDLKALFIAEGIDKTFVEYWWRCHSNLIQNLGTGTTVKGIRLEDIRSLSVDLPPLKEQKRIADKLDSLLMRVDACRDRLDRVSLILDRFRQSVLLLAISGELTTEWREISDESDEWQTVMLSEICKSIVDGTHQAPPQTESGIPFITIAAINDGRLHIEKATRFVSSLYFEQLQPSRKPVIGDILFSVTGSIAIPALVDVDKPFIFQRHIAILKPNSSRIVSKFLFYALSSENIKRQSQSVATGTAQKTIPISRLRAFEIDLPSIDEQIEVVRRIESLFAYIERIEDSYKKAYTQIEQLTPTLLNMAFRGKLVPQDPNDEPASILLERIRLIRVIDEENTVNLPRRKPTSGKSSLSKIIMIERKDIQLSHLSDILKTSGSMTAELLWSSSQLDIDDFYDQLKEEEALGFLKETREETSITSCLLEAI
jgi:type I restriction enzyme, S subunit